MASPSNENYTKLVSNMCKTAVDHESSTNATKQTPNAQL